MVSVQRRPGLGRSASYESGVAEPRQKTSEGRVCPTIALPPIVVNSALGNGELAPLHLTPFWVRAGLDGSGERSWEQGSPATPTAGNCSTRPELLREDAAATVLPALAGAKVATSHRGLPTPAISHAQVPLEISTHPALG